MLNELMHNPRLPGYSPSLGARHPPPTVRSGKLARQPCKPGSRATRSMWPPASPFRRYHTARGPLHQFLTTPPHNVDRQPARPWTLQSLACNPPAARRQMPRISSPDSAHGDWPPPSPSTESRSTSRSRLRKSPMSFSSVHPRSAWFQAGQPVDDPCTRWGVPLPRRSPSRRGRGKA